MYLSPITTTLSHAHNVIRLITEAKHSDYVDHMKILQ